jgi:Holliday junction resolvase
MNIQLKERKRAVLKDLEVKATFKIPECNFVYIKMDVEGLTTFVKQEGKEEQIPVKVKIPDGKLPVLCLNTGSTTFMKLDEKVELVGLEVVEILE